jgi:hypothetical protein
MIMPKLALSQLWHAKFIADINERVFFRWHDKGDKKFPFVGTELSVSNVTTNATGNFKLRPHAGYKYFFNKNVALDVSVGFLVDLNKKRGGSPFITTDRQAKIDGQLGLSFVF